MRLCLHPNKRVHAEALRLLLLLLQGANRKVQKSALATLRVSGPSLSRPRTAGIALLYLVLGFAMSLVAALWWPPASTCSA
eukprot:1971647-Rhodomonas_salina.1